MSFVDGSYSWRWGGGKRVMHICGLSVYGVGDSLTLQVLPGSHFILFTIGLLKMARAGSSSSSFFFLSVSLPT